MPAKNNTVPGACVVYKKGEANVVVLRAGDIDWSRVKRGELARFAV